MVNYIFKKIREAKGSNEKLRIATEEFKIKHHAFMEVCYNFKVYGISGAGIAKAIDFDLNDYGKCEDFGEYLEKLDNDCKLDEWFEKTTYNYKIESIVNSLMQNSGNTQIARLKELLGGIDTHDIPWVIRAISKNMRIGFNLTSYNKVRKAHGMEEIIPYGVQLCGKLPLIYKEDKTLDEEKTLEVFRKFSYPRIAEYKYDGERADIDIQKSSDLINITLTSRGGTDITSQYPEVIVFLKECYKKHDGDLHLKFDSEIISSSFVKLSTRMHRKTENITESDDSLRPIIFDIIKCNDIDTSLWTQVKRRHMLDVFANEDNFDTSYMKIVQYGKELLDFYKEARSIGQEGVVTKDLDMNWTAHSRNGWTKLVPKENLDLKVVDCYYGTGKNAKQINGVIVENAAGTIRTKAASGITDAYRELLTMKHMAGQLIGTIVEIEYRELQPPKDGVSALRFPVFRRIRADKFEAD